MWSGMPLQWRKASAGYPACRRPSRIRHTKRDLKKIISPRIMETASKLVVQTSSWGTNRRLVCGGTCVPHRRNSAWSLCSSTALHIVLETDRMISTEEHPPGESTNQDLNLQTSHVSRSQTLCCLHLNHGYIGGPVVSGLRALWGPRDDLNKPPGPCGDLETTSTRLQGPVGT